MPCASPERVCQSCGRWGCAQLGDSLSLTPAMTCASCRACRAPAAQLSPSLVLQLIEDLRKQLEHLQLFKLEAEQRRGRSSSMGLQEYNSRTRETELEQEIKQLKQVRGAGQGGKHLGCSVCKRGCWFPDDKGWSVGAQGLLPRS